MRAIAASPSRLNSASRTVLLGSSTSAERSSADLESKTIQSVSARRKTAAAVGAENGKLNFRLAPVAIARPEGAGAARAAGTDFGAGAGASAAGAGLGGVVADPAAGAAGAVGGTCGGG